MSTVRLKRAYDPPSPEDGMRVLVDRLWPRGLTREKAGIDLWLKDIAPSTELRRSFGHDKAKWSEFRDRYVAELTANPEPLEKLRALVKENERVTLLYAARDTERNNAVVLQEVLRSRSR